MSKKKVFYISFFVVLFVVFYFVLTKIIPGYGDVKLPVLSNVRPFAFTNQDGKLITEKDVAGKVFVAEYFFTTCKGICPKLNTNMKILFEQYKNNPDFLILSHTVDPQTDSVARLKHYADSLGADSKTWWFLTGRKDSLYNTARVSYLLDDPKNNNISINDQFIHTQFFALVDKNGQVRKICDGLKKDEIEELKMDIDNLLKGKVADAHAASTFLQQ
ncbi:MAG: SCO family protein [Bacteroidetes bacterium]|nr:SCO family protein [Bacteroidota bacterium]MBS1933389.1 SCO family protein [Bacteroidota bacterium]